MQKIFTLCLVTVALLALTATVAAQDANNPWHVVAFEGDKEVAFYNTEVITAIEATTQTVTVALANGKKFTHPTATTTFGFDPRRNGSATANESLTLPQWHVQYANGSLHFSEPVSGIAFYSLAGVLVAKFAGFYTEIPLTLPQGLYIIQANGQSAKLLVSAAGTGSTTAQPAPTETPTATYTSDLSKTTLRAATIKIYWNVKAGDNVTPIHIPDVESFYFKDNSLFFNMGAGNTLQLDNYQSAAFAFSDTPAQSGSYGDWDVEKTNKYCGIVIGNIGDSAIYFTAVHKTKGVLIYDMTRNKKIIIKPGDIDPKAWTIEPEHTNHCVSVLYDNSGFTYGVSSFFDLFGDGTHVIGTALFNGYKSITPAAWWDFNGGKNFLPSTKTIGEKVHISGFDMEGKAIAYTFNPGEW